MEQRQYRIDNAGLGLQVTEWGPASGAPVVMLHGIRGYGETFRGVAEALQADAYRVIALDQRGRGGSDWDPRANYYTDAYVDDVRALVDGLGLCRFTLLGHSMGGINAIAYAARYPDQVRRLVIEDAGPGAFESSPGAARIRGEFMTTPAEFASWEEAGTFMRALRPSVTEEARQQRLQSMLRPLAGGTFTWRYDHAGIAATRLDPDPARIVDLRPLIAALRCPTLVLRGARTDYLQSEMAKAMQALNPQVRHLEIADAGHYIHDDQPQAFNAAVLSFLRQETPT